MKRGILVLLIAVTGTLYLSLRSPFEEEATAREKLSSVINSEYQEVRPLISPDGLTLYFGRRNHPENIGGLKDFQDIWVSYNLHGTWSQPTNFGKPINNKKPNTLCAVNTDGNYMILLDRYNKVSSPLAQAYKSTDGWSTPTELNIQGFSNKSAYYDFYYHQQSMVLIMAIDDGRGYGKQDLHVSFQLKDGSYSRPKNLGGMVNSKKSDFAPFLAADGKTLFFASYGHKGLGGSDLYVTQRLDDSWNRWSTPINLGQGINSRQDENYLSVTEDFSFIYFESYSSGSKEGDIYRSSLPKWFPQYLAPQDGISNNNVVVARSGPTPATLEQTPKQKAPADMSKKLSEEKQEMPFLGNLAVQQYLQEGQIKSRVLSNTYFSYDSYQLSSKCISTLKEISKVLQKNPSMEVLLEGHADNRGTKNGKLRISYLRAQAAAHFLVDQGLSGNRLQVIGNTDRSPLASNDDEQEGRELNRRVEITLINTAGVNNE